jgi:hypothetical protein
MQLDDVRLSNAKLLAFPEGWAEFTLRLRGNAAGTDCSPADFIHWLAVASPRVHRQAVELALHLSAFPWRISMGAKDLQTNPNVLVVTVSTGKLSHSVHMRRLPELAVVRIEVNTEAKRGTKRETKSETKSDKQSAAAK